MYLPPHFEQDDVGKIHGLIRDYPLGILVTAGPEGVDANHLPFLLDPDRGPQGTLLCHVARANPVWRALAGCGAESLVVFQGPGAYVSPSLYETKRTTHEVVPTYKEDEPEPQRRGSARRSRRPGRLRPSCGSRRGSHDEGRRNGIGWLNMPRSPLR